MRPCWSRLALGIAVVVLAFPLTGCTMTPGFFFCLVSGNLNSLECRVDALAPGPPAPPTGVSASLVSTDSRQPKVLVDWKANQEPDVERYFVYWSKESGGPYGSPHDPATQQDEFPTKFAHECASEDVGCALNVCTLYYVVTALDAARQQSGYSKEASVRINCDAPAAPAGLKAEGATKAVSLRWIRNREDDLFGYNVYRSQQASGPFENVSSSVRDVVYDDTPLPSGTEFFYRVTAVDRAGNESPPTAVVSATTRGAPPPPDDPPAVPSGLIATPGDARVALDWADNSEPDLAGYIVTRKTSPNETGGVDSALLTASDYLDTELASGTYFYVVRARDQAGNLSAPSDAVNATPFDGTPAAPTGLVATPGDESVSLDWADNQEPDLAGYNIYGAQSPGPLTKINSALVPDSMYVASGLTNGTTYDFYVAAVDAGTHESSGSAVVSATPCAGCFTGAFWGALSWRVTPGQPAATKPRVSAARGTRSFQLTVSGRYSEGGRTSVSRGSLIGKGLVFTGSFALRSGSTALRGTWRSRIDWRLRPKARRGSAAGVALVTFADRKLGEACLRFKETYVAKKRSRKIETRGSFTLLGGTAQAAKLLGRGSYRVPMRTDRTVVYRGKARAGKGGRNVPSACKALKSRRR